MEFCPPLFFEVMPDGSHRRLKAAPQGHHPAASRRQPASHHPVGRRGSFSRASEDDDDEPGLRGRGVHRSSSRASASSIQRRGSIRSEDSLERFAAASARYSIAGSSDGSRPGSAGGLRRRSSLTRRGSNASRRSASFSREAFSDSDLSPVVIAPENESDRRKKKKKRRPSQEDRARSPARQEERIVTKRSKETVIRARSPPPQQGRARRAVSPGRGPAPAGGEVLVSPTGDMFLISGGQAVVLRVVGRAPGGAQLVQSGTGDMFLIQDGQAIPLQRGVAGGPMAAIDGGKKKKTKDDPFR